MGWGQSCIDVKFLYAIEIEVILIQISVINFRILSATPTVTTKKIAIDYTQKQMRKDLKSFTTKKEQINTKEDINAGNEGQNNL